MDLLCLDSLEAKGPMEALAAPLVDALTQGWKLGRLSNRKRDFRRSDSANGINRRRVHVYVFFCLFVCLFVCLFMFSWVFDYLYRDESEGRNTCVSMGACVFVQICQVRAKACPGCTWVVCYHCGSIHLFGE